MTERWKKAYNPDHLPGFIETFIIFCIVLVIVHTIVEDLGIIFHWNHQIMFYLTLGAFAFDVIFCLEFTARSFITAKHGHFKHYILHERGWIDLLTSFPLLLLVSGPALFLFLTDAHTDSAFFNFLIILKTAKAIRVTRILRLIRVIKIFGKIQNTESRMTNRHVATISTLAVVSLIVVLVVSQFIPSLHFGDHEAYKEHRIAQLSGMAAVLPRVPEIERPEVLRAMIQASGAGDIIQVKHTGGQVLFEASADVREQLKWTAFPGEIAVPGADLLVRMSFHAADSEHAKLNIIILLCILAIIGAFMLFYTRVFAQQITDPIYVMDRGLREWDYNLEVKVQAGREEEEIFRLARVYNSRWLTLKSQIQSFKKARGDTSKSVLNLDQIL